MKTIKQLLEKRAELGAEIKSLYRAHKAGEASDADESRLDELFEEFERVDDEYTMRSKAELVSGAGFPLEGYEAPRHSRADDADDTQAVDKYIDGKGNIVPALRRGQSYLDMLRRSRLDRPEEMKTFNMAEAFRGMTGAQGSTGGFTLPATLSAMVIDLARNQARVTQAGARIVPMPTRQMTIAKVTGDPTAYWVGEGKALTASTMTLGAVNLDARTVGVIVESTEDLLDDAPGSQQIIVNALAQKLALELDRVCLFGNGTSEPLGVWNMPDVQSQTITAPAVLTHDDLSRMVQKIAQVNGTANAWLLNPLTNHYLYRMQMGTGEWLPPSPDVATLARLATNQIGEAHGSGSNESPCFIGQFDSLLIGVRQNIRIEPFNAGTVGSSNAVTERKVFFRATMRCDVNAERENFLCKLLGNLSADLD